MTVRFVHDGSMVAYMIDRAERDIVGSGDPDFDTVAFLATEALSTGMPIGPGIGVYDGAVGTWADPVHVLAAFHDAARAVGGVVVEWNVDIVQPRTPPPPPPVAPKADPTAMTRDQRLAEASRRWSEWAASASTDNPPDTLNVDLALSEAYWRRLSRRDQN